MNATDLECRALLTTNFMSFVERCFMELHPDLRFSYAPYLEVLAAKLASAVSGDGPRRLIINLPPRSLKSISASVALPAWILGHDPTKQIICASYGQDLADKLAHDTRTILSSRFYRELFPGTVISPSKRAVDDFSTTKYGFRMSTSVGGVLTGRGADIIVIDDPQKPGEALSETLRRSVNDWYDNTLVSRLNNKETGVIIIVMQRLHRDDLVGHVLESGEGWEVVNFPAIAEEDQKITVRTIVGPFTFSRRAGQVLDPSRESLATLETIRQTIGTYNFYAQYQGNPTPVGGAMILRDWLQYYDPAGYLPPFSMILQSWDTANKSGELNDYSVCTTWGLYDGRYYLLHVFRKRLIYPDLKRAVVDLASRFQPHRILIEDKASGTQLIQELKAACVPGVTSYEPPPQTDKIMRVNAQTAKFEAGWVLLPSGETWLEDFVRELTVFPGDKYDDQVDSTTQALDYLGNEGMGLDIWAKLGRM
jgi:predicted phage terminase large subunit-like protein